MIKEEWDVLLGSIFCLHFSQKQSSSLKSHATSGYCSNSQLSITCSTDSILGLFFIFFHDMNLIKKYGQRHYYNKALKVLSIFPVIKCIYQLPGFLNLCRIFTCVIIFLSIGYSTIELTSFLRLNLHNTW